MKFNEMKLFVFIASVIIGVLISMNISLGNNNAAIMVSSQQYQKLLEQRADLQKEIMNLEEQRHENNSKLSIYKNSASTAVMQEMKTEFENTSLLLGTSEVSGQGIKISINDHSYDFDNSIEGSAWKEEYIIHFSDLVEIVKALRNVGAKAISVNGLRVTGTSSFICAGEFIELDRVKISAPFQITAIGNKDALYNYMQTENGNIQFMRRDRSINVFISKEDNVVVPSYIGKISSSYLKPAKD